MKLNKTNLIVSQIEHDSVIRAARSLVKDFGFSVTWLLPDETGRISEEQVSAAILPETGLCSVMYVNNELGTVNPVSKIGALCHEHGVLFHTDVTQALSAYPIDVGYLNCDFLSASAHKIHGPMGVGLLYAKDTSLLTPQIYGGEDQELGLRGGTENVPGIAGFASAVSALDLWRVSWQQDIRAVRERFLQALEYALKSKGIPDSMVYTVDPAHTVPNILSLRFPGIDSETMMAMLSQVGVCVSSGSACRAHSSDPSLVLLSLGLSADEARSTLRVSFSHFNTQDEAAVAAFRFADVASMLLQ